MHIEAVERLAAGESGVVGATKSTITLRPVEDAEAVDSNCGGVVLAAEQSVGSTAR